MQGLSGRHGPKTIVIVSEAKARLATIAGAYNAPNASEEQTLALQIEWICFWNASRSRVNDRASRVHGAWTIKPPGGAV
jgi:hypothetical protein